MSPAAALDGQPTFRVTLAGTITAEWSYEFPDSPDGDCVVGHTDSGSRVIRFRTSAPTSFAVKTGRLARGDLVNVAGTATTTGSEVVTRTCDGVDQTTPLDCPPHERDFATARVRLTTRLDSVILGTLRGGFAKGTSRCPATPPAGELARMPTLGSVHVSLARLIRATRVRIPAGREQTLVLGGNGDGQLTWTIDWTLTLTRARS